MEVELPRAMSELPTDMQPVEQFADLSCGAVLGRNLAFAGFATPTPVQVVPPLPPLSLCGLSCAPQLCGSAVRRLHFHLHLTSPDLT